MVLPTPPRDTIIDRVVKIGASSGYFYRVTGRVQGRPASIDVPVTQLKTPPYDRWTDAEVREFFLRSLPLGVEGRYTPHGVDLEEEGR